MTTGIYSLTNPDGQVYIGASTNIEARIKHHQVTNGKAHSKLRTSFLKYGWDGHIPRVLETCSREQLLERERYWQDYYTPVMLNRRKNGVNGIKPWTSEATRLLQSQALTGRKRAMKNKKHTAVTKQKMSAAKKGTGRVIRMSQLDGTVVVEATLDVYLAEGLSRQCISMACLGKIKTYKNFIWEYVTPEAYKSPRKRRAAIDLFK